MTSSGASISFRDVILLTLAGFVAIVILMLPFIKEAKRAETAGQAPTGNVIVRINWPAEHDADVDLWVQAPGDVPIGYSNLNGRLFNLLRDDLGHYVDVTEVNQEDAITRGVVPGEYVVNLHLYSNASRRYPVPVTVHLWTWSGAGVVRELLASRVDLAFIGQETTVFRFGLTADGSLVPGSVHSIFRPLRGSRT